MRREEAPFQNPAVNQFDAVWFSDYYASYHIRAVVEASTGEQLVMQLVYQSHPIQKTANAFLVNEMPVHHIWWAKY